MNEEEMDLYKIKGLGLSTEAGSAGYYIIFMRSRDGNIKFFTWFIEEVVCPVVDNLKVFYELQPDDPTFLQLDGEPIHIQCFQQVSTIEKLKERNIDVGKSFHSGTAVTQPCDAGNLFRASKAVNKCLKETEIINEFVFKRVKNVFKEHNKKMNPVTEPVVNASKKVKAKSLTPSHVKMGSTGIMRLQYSLEVAISQSTKYFKITGCFPYS